MVSLYLNVFGGIVMDRKSPLDWDEYYLWIAMAAAVRSKDPVTRVGAVAVKGSSIVTGYNGFPAGVQDAEDRWDKPAKYDFVAHAERNALDNAHFDVSGGTLYVTHYPPCNECVKTIIQRGIKRVVCGDWAWSKTIDRAKTEERTRISLDMLFEAGVEIKKLYSSQIYDRAIGIVQRFIDEATTT
jgi:dCMP deaminase